MTDRPTDTHYKILIDIKDYHIQKRLYNSQRDIANNRVPSFYRN